MKVRENWTTRLGFYFAAIGSAFGLGNLWRFPYIVKENGGGAFVLLYVFLAFFIGVPLVIGELMLGKSTQQSVLGALRDLVVKNEEGHQRKWWIWIGKLAVGTSLLVLSYYAVISGWVLHFFMRFSAGLFDPSLFDASEALTILRDSGGLQVALASVHLLLTIIIVSKGLQNGMERWLGYVMSAFSLLLILLIFKSLSLSTSSEALRFLLYPDFSKLSMSSLGQALGHMLFTLSIGFGMMVTFGSYLRHDIYVPEAGLRVAVLNTSIALLAGLLIFPILLSITMAEGGPDVLFQALPHFFDSVSGGRLFGAAFFLCLYLSALGASIGLLEVIVSNLADRWGVSRSKACWGIGGVAFLMAIFPALSSSTLSAVTLRGKGLLQVLDGFLINWLLPVVAIGLCLVVAHVLPFEKKRKRVSCCEAF